MEEQLDLFDFVPDGLVAGCDEAGRGPLAGPLAVAAVILPDDFDTSLLRDSKKLSEKRRFELEPIIKEGATAWTVILISPEEIDEKNILRATMDGMAQCYRNLEKEHPIRTYYVDGNRKPVIEGCLANIEAVVKGDDKIPEIMAASILAKTARDHYMIEVADKKWPMYGFAKHKGYGTKEHCEAIAQYGRCPIHRKSFILHNTKPVEDGGKS